MFGFTLPLFRSQANAFTVFLIKNKKNPVLAACKTIKERAKKTTALYNKLTDAEKAKLAAESKKLNK